MPHSSATACATSRRISHTATRSASGMSRAILRTCTLPIRPVPMTAIFIFLISSSPLSIGRGDGGEGTLQRHHDLHRALLMVLHGPGIESQAVKCIESLLERDYLRKEGRHVQ